MVEQVVDVDFKKNLLSPNGAFYLVAIKQNDIPKLLTFDSRLHGSVVLHRWCGIEHLFVLKFTRKHEENAGPM
ncbi:unnamed protein product [Soboliphyme baturini]|uniref:Uncharacterized protein n=1 Tax=Soboliphyme baturini TaxID=241478 RepID=A0A183IA28_9BILA|nr:unnamed protein product [Soboliphyme baturini]